MKQPLLHILLLVAACSVGSTSQAQALRKRLTYDQGEIYQISWYIIAERPISGKKVLKRPTHTEIIPSGKRLARIARQLPGHKPSTPGKVADIRLVGLFHTAERTDTLLIDAVERCTFGGEQFQLTRRLAKLLDARDIGLNPRETKRIRAASKRGKAEFKKQAQTVK